ncbi:hypothetical protein CBR_g48937, partial [Chara braunii]
DQDSIQMGWHPELVTYIRPFCMLKPPNVHCQIAMLAIPADVLLQVHNATNGQAPFLIENMTFSDRATLVAVLQTRPQELSDKIKELAANIAEVCRKSAIENRELNLIIAKTEKVILDLHGYDSSHLNSTGQISTNNATETFTESYISSIALTPAELEYFKRKETLRREAAHINISSTTGGTGHKFSKNNSFLPLASRIWTEKAVQHVHNRLWKMDTFNYTAPISVDAYMALAAMTVADIDNCRTAARTGTISLPSGRAGLDVEFPAISKLEKGKCAKNPLLYQKGIPKFPTDLLELKKLWNAGRPFLKCPCPGCEINFTWLDHMLCYVIGNLDKLDPLAPSDKIRMLEFQTLLRTTWKKPILAQDSFIFMREYMMKILHLITENKVISIEEILGFKDFKEVPFVRKFTAALLPNAEGVLAQTPSRREGTGDFEGNSLRRCRQMRLGTSQTGSPITCTPPSRTPQQAHTPGSDATASFTTLHPASASTPGLQTHQWTQGYIGAIVHLQRDEQANPEIIQISSNEAKDGDNPQLPIRIGSLSPDAPLRPGSAIEALRHNYGASSADSSLLRTASDQTTLGAESATSDDSWKRVCRRLSPDYRLGGTSIARS